MHKRHFSAVLKNLGRCWPKWPLFFVSCMAIVSCHLLEFNFNNKETATTIRKLKEPFRFTILHTNDLHSQFIGSGPDVLYTPTQDGDPVKGGYARLAHLVQSIRKEKSLSNEPVILVDAGDFFAGSLFHTVAVSKETDVTPELDFFSFLEYDAVSLGNHEFDATEKGLALMLEKAESKGLRVPIVLSNERRSKESALEGFYDPERKTKISEHLVKTLDNGKESLTICIFGALGPDAAFASANDRQNTFFYGIDAKTNRKNLKDLSLRMSAALTDARKQSNCQFNILLIHAGDPEDSELAQSVPGLDVVVSGHTHQVYFKEVTDGRRKVIVSQAGSHGSHLGKLELEVSNTDTTVVNQEKEMHIPIDDAIQSSNEVEELIESYKQEISKMNLRESAQNSNPFYDLKLKFDSPVARVDRDRPFERDYPNNKLGSYLFSRLKAASTLCIDQFASKTSASTEAKRAVDVYFSTLSLVRNAFLTNGGQPVTYQYSDMFKFFSIGFDDDLHAGNEVYHFYLKKDEFKLLTEFFEIYRFVTPLATPGFSANFRYAIRSWGIPLVNRVARATLDEKDYDAWPELIHLATNKIIVSYLEKISTLSRGFVNLRPRTATGEWGQAVRLPCQMKEHELLTTDFLRAGY